MDLHDGGIFVVVAAVLFISAIAGVVARSLRQPVIVAFIAVGILLGPGLGVIEPDVPEFALLAQLGISLLLFLVGLELDLRLIKRVGPVALATGLGQVAFTSGVGFVIVLLLGYSVAAAVYIAVALTFSSTIIIVKLLSDKKETDQTHGRIAIGFLIVQDIVVVIALIALAALGAPEAGAGVGLQLLLTFGRGLLFVGAVAVLMHWVLGPLMDRVARSAEILVLFAIAWAVALAAVGELLGFSEEVGAFIAGVSLASTRYRESIGSRLRSVRDFLLLFFFIDLGARMDVTQAVDQLPAVFLLSAFVLIGNPLIVMFIMATLMRYPRRIAFLCGVTVAQISEFSLILVALGFQLGHVDDATVDLVTLVGLITIGLSTYLIINAQAIYERIERPLRVFQRGRVRRVQLEDEELRPEVVVFGLGRYGSAVVTDLTEAGIDVLGVDIDPRVVGRWADEGVAVIYGAADDTDLVEELPIDHARWVVSTIPDSMIGRTLLQTLRNAGYRGQVAVTVDDPDQATRLRKEGADHVFVPLLNAAHETVRVLGVPRDPGTIEAPPP
ncbi:MAG TPA: cation:proton antiporter [Egibacteraceae bacterium]|nr:cation:proton antiporter [Egibacteraceae bacterium]